MTDALTQLSKMTVIVADTGDLETVARLKPTDATTNPSLIYQSASNPKYAHLVDAAVQWGAKQDAVSADERVALTLDKLTVAFGVELLKIVPGVVSTEVDARLSFDTQASVDRARRIIKLYEDQGVKRDRVLIKLASTWEGIRAGAILEKEGIHCNLTLLFSFAQAVACAEAGVTLISPFVGRIKDWYSKKTGDNYDDSSKDPGVLSVSKIYSHYKKYGFKTIVMGASFRNVGEIIELAGVDKVTVPPNLLDQLSALQSTVTRKLAPPASEEKAPAPLTEAQFRYEHNDDAMGTEKLAEGIRNFVADIIKTEKVVKDKLAAAGVKLDA